MIKQRFANLMLIGAALLGSFLVLRAGQERYRLEAEYDRLSAITGTLAIGDPEKIAIRAIDTGEPLHFAWRVYLPPNYRQIVTSSAGTSSESQSSDSVQFIARVRFQLDEQGCLQVYIRFSGGSSQTTLGDRRLADLLKGKWGRIRVMRLGEAHVAKLAVDQPAVLLQLTLPSEMQQAARQTLPADMQKTFVPVLYKLTLGPRQTNP